MYDREDDLRQKFNAAIQRLLGVPRADYYGTLSFEGVISLKRTLSVINNIVTLRLTLMLGKWICNRFNVKDTDAVNKAITACKPNANGYDIQLDDPDVIAEVKCNIPTKGGNIYGAEQKNGLVKDMRSLLRGKSKSKKKIDHSIKILGLYDSDAVRKATSHLMKNLPDDLRGKIEQEPTQHGTLKQDKLYVIYLSIDDGSAK